MNFCLNTSHTYSSGLIQAYYWINTRSNCDKLWTNMVSLWPTFYHSTLPDPHCTVSRLVSSEVETPAKDNGRIFAEDSEQLEDRRASTRIFWKINLIMGGDLGGLGGRSPQKFEVGAHASVPPIFWEVVFVGCARKHEQSEKRCHRWIILLNRGISRQDMTHSKDMGNFFWKETKNPKIMVDD